MEQDFDSASDLKNSVCASNSSDVDAKDQSVFLMVAMVFIGAITFVFIVFLRSTYHRQHSDKYEEAGEEEEDSVSASSASSSSKSDKFYDVKEKEEDEDSDKAVVERVGSVERAVESVDKGFEYLNEYDK